jgi:prolyl-tRNA editing enzyme YbaK/EbsC (Cys-tRNA(Pro) deacylase)
VDLSSYHPTVTQIINLLTSQNVWFETFEHEPVITSHEAAQTRSNYTLSQGAKSLILRIKKGSDKKFVMLVLPGDVRFDDTKIKNLLDVIDIRFATPEEVSQITDGVLPGGIPPFGNLFNLEVFTDPILFENEKIIFNAGDRRFSVAMKSEDYKNIVNPQIESIIK